MSLEDALRENTKAINSLIEALAEKPQATAEKPQPPVENKPKPRAKKAEPKPKAEVVDIKPTPTVSREEVKAVLLEVSQKVNRESAREILITCGAKSLPGLDPEKFEEAHKAALEALKGISA